MGRRGAGKAVDFTRPHRRAEAAATASCKRGMKGICQHCGEKHLHRYLAEYDFRYNTRTKLGFTDEERRDAILLNAEGKRLTDRRTAQFHGGAY